MLCFPLKSGSSFVDNVQANTSSLYLHSAHTCIFSTKRRINQSSVASFHCYWCDKYFIRQTKRLLLPMINIASTSTHIPARLAYTHYTCRKENEKYAKCASQIFLCDKSYRFGWYEPYSSQWLQMCKTIMKKRHTENSERAPTKAKINYKFATSDSSYETHTKKHERMKQKRKNK